MFLSTTMRQFGSDLYDEWIIAVAILSALIALPLAMGITLVLVRLFRARVERSMRATIGGPVNLESHRPALGGPQGDLEIERIEATRKQASAARAVPVLADARRHARQLAAICAGAACAYPLISAAAFGVMTSGPAAESAPVQQVMLVSAAVYGLAFLQLATPVVLAPTMVLTKQPRFLILAVLIFLILLWVVGSSVDARMYVILWILAVVPILAILVTIVLKSQPRLLMLLALALIAALGLSAWGRSTASHTHVVGLWALVAGVPTAAVLLLNTRRLRAVGPVVFAATLLLLYGIGAGLGYMAFYVGDAIGPVRLVHGDLAQLPLVDAARQYFREISGLPLREMPAAMSAYLHALRAENPEGLTLTVKLNSYAIWFAGTALGTLAGLAIIRWLADNYKRRRASDQMLMIDVMMVVFIVPTAVFLFFLSGWIALACMPASFAGYKLFARWRLQRRNRSAPPVMPRALLLLRVFGFDRRTQRLLEELGQRWRYFGPIRLIGGTDLAYATIEPHEFFDFLNGRLSRAFVEDEDDLESRLSESITVADPDGLFRIEDFFCHDDTWRMTVSRLARGADAVLMDLRGFSPANRGCIFEIEQLIASVSLHRIVLLADASTDLPFLELTLRDAWRIMSSDSPNAVAGRHRVRILQASSSHGRTLDTLLGLLCESFGEGALTRVAAS